MAKSTPPNTDPISGMMMSPVRLATIVANAAPMITATARSSEIELLREIRDELRKR